MLPDRLIIVDVVASDIDGYPIEVGLAHADLETGQIECKSEIIRPLPEWVQRYAWEGDDVSAPGRLSLRDLQFYGADAEEVATWTALEIGGQDVYSNRAVIDSGWLRMLLMHSRIPLAPVVRQLMLPPCRRRSSCPSMRRPGTRT